MGSIEHVQVKTLQNCETGIHVCSRILHFSQHFPIDVSQNCVTLTADCSTDTLYFNPMKHRPIKKCSGFTSLLQLQDSQDPDPITKWIHVQHCSTHSFQLHYLPK